MAKRPKVKTVMLTLRIPIELRAALRKAAKADHRSVNGLVIALLAPGILTSAKARAERSSSALWRELQANAAKSRS